MGNKQLPTACTSFGGHWRCKLEANRSWKSITSTELQTEGYKVASRWCIQHQWTGAAEWLSLRVGERKGEEEGRGEGRGRGGGETNHTRHHHCSLKRGLRDWNEQ